MVLSDDAIRFLSEAEIASKCLGTDFDTFVGDGMGLMSSTDLSDESMDESEELDEEVEESSSDLSRRRPWRRFLFLGAAGTSFSVDDSLSSLWIGFRRPRRGFAAWEGEATAAAKGMLAKKSRSLMGPGRKR